MLIVIILGNVVDQILGLQGANTYATVLFYIMNEGLSIVENMAELDVLIPANFAVLRQTSMPAMLTENLLIDTKADADLLKGNALLNKVAQGHANGIIKAFGLSKTTDPNSDFIWVGTDKKGRHVESIYRGSEGLNYYDGTRRTKPSGTFGYGQGWIVDKLYRVGGSLMYRVQNSKDKLYWITASSKYVKVV